MWVFGHNSGVSVVHVGMTGLSLRPEFSTQLERSSPWGNLGPRPRRLFPSGFFLGFVGGWSLRAGPPPPLEWNSILPLVTVVLITPKGAESPDSRRTGVISALVRILPSETVQDKLSSP